MCSYLTGMATLPECHLVIHCGGAGQAKKKIMFLPKLSAEERVWMDNGLPVNVNPEDFNVDQVYQN